MGGISITKLLIIAVIVVLFFGTKKLRNLGSDLGSSIKGFKKAMSDDEKNDTQDADFDGKSLTEHHSSTPKEEIRKDKDQV